MLTCHVSSGIAVVLLGRDFDWERKQIHRTRDRQTERECSRWILGKDFRLMAEETRTQETELYACRGYVAEVSFKREPGTMISRPVETGHFYQLRRRVRSAKRPQTSCARIALAHDRFL